jgi:hypothetical protein
MSNKQVQFRYDSATNLNAATPALAEPAYDQTANRLRVGDGTTAGGIPMAKVSDLPAASSTTVAGLVEKATDAELYASTTDKNVTADHLTSASALVALTDAAPVAVDWTAGINFSLTVTAARQIDNPTNEIPGTYRTILVQGDSATDHTITFGAEFLGTVPTITDCDADRWYLLTIRCIAASHFAVTAQKVKGT